MNISLYIFSGTKNNIEHTIIDKMMIFFIAILS